MVAALSALDSILMVDQEEGYLNKVSTERLARKAMALEKAYERVTQRSDWQRPKGKEGTARDVNTSKGGNITVTIVQADGVRFKTLARSCEKC